MLKISSWNRNLNIISLDTPQLFIFARKPLQFWPKSWILWPARWNESGSWLDRCLWDHMWLMAGSWEAGCAVWAASPGSTCSTSEPPHQSPRLAGVGCTARAIPGSHCHTHEKYAYSHTHTPVYGCFFQYVCEVGILTVAGSSCSMLHLSLGDKCWRNQRWNHLPDSRCTSVFI